MHHDVEVAHSRQEIQIAVAAIATTGVIKRVHRSVAPEELLVLFDHRRAHRLVHRRPLATDEGLRKQRLREYFVSRLVQVTAVDRQVATARSHRLLRGREHICKAHPLRCRHLAHHLGIRRDVLVIPIRCRHALHVFIGNRRHQNNPRPTLTIKRLRLQTRHIRGELLAKLRQPGLARKGFVEPVRRKDHIRFSNGEMLLHIRKIRRARLRAQLIRRPREIAHHQFRLRMRLLQRRLEMPKMLRPIQQRVANKRNPRPLLKLQRQRRPYGLRRLRPRRRFLKNRIPRQLRILHRRLLPRLGILRIIRPRRLRIFLGFYPETKLQDQH